MSIDELNKLINKLILLIYNTKPLFLKVSIGDIYSCVFSFVQIIVARLINSSRVEPRFKILVSVLVSEECLNCRLKLMILDYSFPWVRLLKTE